MASPDPSTASASATAANTVHAPSKLSGTFSNIGSIVLTICVINTWIAVLLGLDGGLRSGGCSALVWGLVYATLCTFATVLSHGEMFAVLPTAAGQYAWAFLISSSDWRCGVSWLTGMTNVIGVWLGGTAAAFLYGILMSGADMTAQLIISMIQLNAPNVEISPGEAYGIFAGLVVLCPLICLLGNRANRIIEAFIMLLAVLSALSIIITILVMQENKASPSFVFGQVIPAPGYSSLVISWLIGILPSQFSFCGFDLVYHISEEMRDPAKDGPTAAKWIIGLSGFWAFVMLVCVLFCIPDGDVAYGMDYSLAITRIIISSTRSNTATTVFILFILLIFANTVRGINMTAARIMFAFGQDGILPCERFFTTVKLGEPVGGMAVTVCIQLVLGLVQLGPFAAFNSLLGASVIFTFSSYGIPCVMMMLGGRARLDTIQPDRLHNLGPLWGPVSNIVAIFFTLQAIVIYCFPPALPVTSDNMNYVAVYVVGFLIIMAVIYYGFAKKRYKGPKILNPPENTTPPSLGSLQGSGHAIDRPAMKPGLSELSGRTEI